ncbi:MAG: ABC transporter permease [Planctomycetaceae bacterium]|nr:ABC transporter permease [Planctomycetaceae bacterium]
MSLIEQLGRRTYDRIEGFGDLCRFSGRTLSWMLSSALTRRNLKLLMYQLYSVGVLSIPVVMITGMFIGAVLAVQTVEQFKGIGMLPMMGTIVNLSVLRELGPVLAGVLLAGRVGGGMTAELGTMRVTEQIDALWVMGSSPIQVLVVPRVMACILLIPVLVLYANAMGILGGYIVSVKIYDVNSSDFWRYASQAVTLWDIFYGLIKSVFFGAAISVIGCYKGFRCTSGAAGVGRACTESFVASCVVILALDFFVGMGLNTLYNAFHPIQSVLQ